MSWDQSVFLLEIKRRKNFIDQYMQRYLPRDAFPSRIHQAMHYAVFNGGKRLRPILVLEGAVLAKGGWDLVAPTACAMELIHCYTLVHDDLPAMDDDDFRRGQPTCHKVYGEAIAVLTGDALLTAAFEIMAGNLRDGIKTEAVLRVIGEVAKAIGSQGTIGGQVLDLAAEHQLIGYEDLKTLHDLKTGVLFKSCLRAGAILAGMDEGRLNFLTKYGHHFGLAFQITDDILDVCGDQTLLGKPLGSDQKNDKATYVSLLGMDKAEKLARENVEACQDILSIFGSEADFLRDLAFYVLVRES